MDVTGYGYEQSGSIVNMAPALVKALEEIGNAAKDSTNPAFRSKYADLASVKEAAAPIYKHGIAVTQQVISAPDGTPGLRNTLLHASGEWMASWAYCKPDKSGPQAVGAVITYLRRYMLAAALNIAQEDDDATGAEKPRNGNGHQQQSAPPPPPPRPAAAPPDQRPRPWMSRLQAAITKLGLGDSRADAEKMKGKKRDDFVRDCRIAYLRWACGRDNIHSTLDLTDDEALKKVIPRAENGEMPS